MIRVEYARYRAYSKPAGAASLGPYVAVSLQHGGRHHDTLGLIDSGADSTLFNLQWALAFGLPLDPTKAEPGGGVGGAIKVWRHKIHLIALGQRIEADVAFTDGWRMEFGLLGRADFFPFFDLGFDQAGNRFLYNKRS